GRQGWRRLDSPQYVGGACTSANRSVLPRRELLRDPGAVVRRPGPALHRPFAVELDDGGRPRELSAIEAHHGIFVAGVHVQQPARGECGGGGRLGDAGREPAGRDGRHPAALLITSRSRREMAVDLLSDTLADLRADAVVTGHFSLTAPWAFLKAAV